LPSSGGCFCGKSGTMISLDYLDSLDSLLILRIMAIV
jgi:hypothetical protein